MRYSVHLGRICLSRWEAIKAWLDENNIKWYAGGNHCIEFDDEQTAAFFRLKWI